MFLFFAKLFAVGLEGAIAEGNFGQMVAIQNDHVTSIPLSETEGKLKLVSRDHALIQRAMDIGTCFGADLN